MNHRESHNTVFSHSCWNSKWLCAAARKLKIDYFDDGSVFVVRAEESDRLAHKYRKIHDNFYRRGVEHRQERLMELRELRGEMV